MMELDTRGALHLIAELTELVRVAACARTKRALLSSSILGVALATEGGAGVIRLVAIWSPLLGTISACLG